MTKEQAKIDQLIIENSILTSHVSLINDVLKILMGESTNSQNIIKLYNSRINADTVKNLQKCKDFVFDNSNIELAIQALSSKS